MATIYPLRDAVIYDRVLGRFWTGRDWTRELRRAYVYKTGNTAARAARRILDLGMYHLGELEWMSLELAEKTTGAGR